MGDFNKILGQVATDVGTLKSDVSTLKSDVRTLKSDVGTLKSDVAVLKSEVAELKTDVATLKSDFDDMSDRQGVMDKKLDTIAEIVTISQKTNDRRFHRIEDHLHISVRT